MEINKTISLNSQIRVGTEIVAHLSANVNSSNYSMNISTNITNKVLADANIETVKSQYAEFELEVKTTASELGYTLF